MEIDDLAGVGFAHAHIMDFAHQADVGSDLFEGGGHICDTLRWSIAPMHTIGFHRFDMSLDLDAWPKLLPDRPFDPARDVVCCTQREHTVDFEIERHGKTIRDRVGRDMMYGESAVAGDHHDALEHSLVIEGAWLGGYGYLGTGAVLAHPLHDPVLERGHAIERQRTAHRNYEVDEQHAARLARAQPLDLHDARDARKGCGYFSCGPSGGGIGQSVERASS